MVIPLTLINHGLKFGFLDLPDCFQFPKEEEIDARKEEHIEDSGRKRRMFVGGKALSAPGQMWRIFIGALELDLATG